LIIAAGTYAEAVFHNYTEPIRTWQTVLALVSFVVCPPQLLFTMCIDCEVIGWDGFAMYAIIAVLNAGLYALIGYIFASARKPA
jgi:hypothetical protein